MKNGLNNQVSGAYKSWSSSSRSSSTNTAADEMMAEGVIYVCAAGNNNQRLGIGANDPDRCIIQVVSCFFIKHLARNFKYFWRKDKRINVVTPRPFAIQGDRKTA